MATPERSFSPETQRRIDAKRERAERLHAAARAAVDKQGVPPVRDRIFDGAEELATKRATAAVELGRPLKAQEERQVRREALAVQRATKTGTRQAASKPSLRDRFERMSEQQRYDALATMRPGTREYAYVEEIVDSIGEEEAAAELLVAAEEQERAAAAAGVDLTPYLVGEDEEDALTEAEWRAEENVAAESAGPLFQGDEDVYDDDDEEEEA